MNDWREDGQAAHQCELEHQQYLLTQGEVMKTHEMKESKFLKKEDVADGALLTITLIDQRNVAMPGADPEMKWCMSFAELEKPMVLNQTNIQLAERALGSDDTDDWVGRKIVAYTDHNVSYGGKIIGGIRLRAVRGKAAQAKPVPAKPVSAPPATTFEEELDADSPPF